MSMTMFAYRSNVAQRNYLLKMKNMFQSVNCGLTTSATRTKTNTKIEPIGWFLLVIPGASLALGTWQVQRKRWKEHLLAELRSWTTTVPIQLPKSLTEINKLEYHPVHVRGSFIHDKEIHLGPRSLLSNGDGDSTSHSTGYLVITPFKLENRKETILVNRGWVSHKNKNPVNRPGGQIEGTVDVEGVIRLHEARPSFFPVNKPTANCWFYRDVTEMCEVTGADPIFLDATTKFDIKEGPIGGQTRIVLRNEHFQYILTFYILSAVTSFMWYKYFIKGIKY